MRTPAATASSYDTTWTLRDVADVDAQGGQEERGSMKGLIRSANARRRHNGLSNQCYIVVRLASVHFVRPPGRGTSPVGPNWAQTVSN